MQIPKFMKYICIVIGWIFLKSSILNYILFNSHLTFLVSFLYFHSFSFPFSTFISFFSLFFSYSQQWPVFFKKITLNSILPLPSLFYYCCSQWWKKKYQKKVKYLPYLKNMKFCAYISCYDFFPSSNSPKLANYKRFFIDILPCDGCWESFSTHRRRGTAHTETVALNNNIELTTTRQRGTTHTGTVALNNNIE